MACHPPGLKLLLLAAVWLPFRGGALTNNLALTPPMGWNDWNSYGCGISQTAVTNTAAVIAANGMKAAGYQFINIDDGWAGSRDANGVIQAYAVSGKFPDGMKWLADCIHAQGLKLGVYTDHGTNTCSSCVSSQTPPKQPGSFSYEYVDAFTYASLGVDYLKDDSCNQAVGSVARDDYFRMADGLMKSGRAITFSLCPNQEHYEYWSPAAGNLWRTTGDIKSTFASMISKIDQNSRAACLAGPGRWNDADMLEVGNGEFTALIPAQSHFSMWCIMAAPLIAGNNVTTMSAQTLSVLTNAEAIAVDQDPAGEQGVRVGGIADVAEVWSKPLGYDFTTRAVVLFNRDTNNSAVITCNWTNLALQSGPATVRDLWAHADLGTFTDRYTATVPPAGAVFLKITGTPVSPPGTGTNYLSDLQPVYAYTGYGTMTQDQSIDGNPLTLDGVAYRKGIGTHAIGGQEYNLGGVGSRFQSTIGVDDEVGTNGSVIFQVFADGRKIYDSGIMTGGTMAKAIDLDVTGVRRLTLGVTDTGNDVVPGTGSRNSYDHSDWADAQVIVTNPVPQLPGAPAGLAASPGNSITLVWNATLAAITYNVKRSTNGGVTFTTLTNVPLTTFTDTRVLAGTNYFYEVSAVSSLGEGPNSVAAGVTPCNVPPVPANVTAVVSHLQVGLQWDAAAGATRYNVSRFTGRTPPVLVASVTATHFTDTNVVNGTTNYYLIAAANDCNQSGYSDFAPAIIQTVNSAAAPVWNGGSATDGNWSDAANWNGITLTAGNALFFDGTNRLDNNNDTAAGMACSGLVFNPSAGAFVLNGNPVTLNGNLVNRSLVPQVVNLGLNFSNTLTFSGTNGTLLIAGGLTNTLGTPGSTTLTLAGAGWLNNALNSVNHPGGTNIVALSDAKANWTLVDNSSSAPMTVPWVFLINCGTFTFGSASSAPVLTTTTPNNSPSDNQVGTVSGATGSFNMMGGILTTGARWNTATALNSTGIVNQTGGVLNIGSQFQGANGGNAGEVSLVSVSGGVLNIGGGGGSFYVASRGTGTLNLGPSAGLNCGTLDVSRNASGNAIGSAGNVNLNGGTILCSRVGTATANAQTNAFNGSSAVFNFNGGTLKINSSTPPFFQGSTVAPVIPISAMVKSGGAFIDSNGQTNLFAEPLQHDRALGAMPDGGLTKNGAGTLILVSNVSYTGNTTINAGTLALSNSVVLNSSPVLAVASGATLDAGGRGDGTLFLVSGQKLTGNGVVKGYVIVDTGATLALGDSVGWMAFSNNLTLSSNSTTVMEINQAAAATNGLVQVAGDLTYSGTLRVTNTGTHAFVAGDHFKLFSAAGYSGGFTKIAPAIPALNLAWDPAGLTQGVLGIVAAPTPPPRFGAPHFSGNNLVLSGTNGVPDWTYGVAVSTNLALPFDRWEQIATNSFDGNGDFNFTNAPRSNAPQTFYRLLLQ